MRKKKKQNGSSDFATAYWQLAFASTETFARRWWMMATGSCPTSEYELMGTEKVKAALETGAIMAAPGVTAAKLVAPWSCALRNAKRLRGRR